MTYFRKENRCTNDLLPFHTVVAMSTALPNLQQIKFGYLGWEHKFNEGEDPDEQVAANKANYITHDIEILYRFRKLRLLKIHYAPLNGRYPLLLNFPLCTSIFEFKQYELAQNGSRGVGEAAIAHRVALT